MLHAFWALGEHGSVGGHVVSKTLSPLITYLVELEISRQFLGKLECVNWSKPFTEHSRYAALMLLSDVRRRVHYEMKDIDLPIKFTAMLSEYLNTYRRPSWSYQPMA
jgi:hypothetical protein